MPAREVVLNKQIEVLKQVLDIIEEHNPEAAQQVRSLVPGGGIPNSGRSLDATITLLAEAVAVLADQIDQQAQATAAPKRRGRKPNIVQKADG